MAYYSYGGHIFPKVPDYGPSLGEGSAGKDNHVLIYADSSGQQWFVPNLYNHYKFWMKETYGGKWEVRPGSNTDKYPLKNGVWSAEDKKDIYAYYSSGIPVEQVLWTNYDILYDDGTVAVAGAGIQQACEPPIITKYGIGNSSNPALKLENVPSVIFGKTSYVYIYCNSTVSDGGTITTEWYVDGALVKKQSSGTGKCFSTLCFKCEAVGEHSIYAVVTNSKNGYASNSVTCATITISVADEKVEQPSYSAPSGVATSTPSWYDENDEDGRTDYSDGSSDYEDEDDGSISYDDLDNTTDGTWGDDITQELYVHDSVAALSLYLGKHVGKMIRSQMNVNEGTKTIEVDGLWASTLPTTATLWLVDEEQYVNDDTSITKRVGEAGVKLTLQGSHLIVEV